MWLYLIIAVLVIGIDQLTKNLVLSHMALFESIDLIPGVLRLTYILNEGAAFGMLNNARWLFIVVSILVIVFAVYFLVKYKPKSLMLRWSLALIIGGGCGNMIDRLFYGSAFGDGAVVDFIDFYLFPFWTWIFNFADACVVVGTAVLVLYLIMDIVKESKNGKGGTSASGADGTDESAGESGDNGNGNESST